MLHRVKACELRLPFRFIRDKFDKRPFFYSGIK